MFEPSEDDWLIFRDPDKVQQLRTNHEAPFSCPDALTHEESGHNCSILKIVNCDYFRMCFHYDEISFKDPYSEKILPLSLQTVPSKKQFDHVYNLLIDKRLELEPSIDDLPFNFEDTTNFTAAIKYDGHEAAWRMFKCAILDYGRHNLDPVRPFPL